MDVIYVFHIFVFFFYFFFFFFFQAEDGIRDHCVTGVQTCALPISFPAGCRGAFHIQSRSRHPAGNANRACRADAASDQKSIGGNHGKRCFAGARRDERGSRAHSAAARWRRTDCPRRHHAGDALFRRENCARHGGRASDVCGRAAQGCAVVSDPSELSLKDLAAAIRRRKVSSAEATKALLARIKKWQPKINAFARVEAEDAMKAARAADRALANGKIKGPLHGVPLAHKDMYYVKGKLAECGSKIRKGWVAPATATAVSRLEAAGAFRLGALNMVEFAFGPTGHNPHTNHVRNPWNPAHITGGSSSGSGAAVAARLVPAALGSDTGGSIRMPAHFCGVTGLKPTNGRVSRANAMPLSFTLDTVGPLARTAEDCALIAAAIAGPDPLDPTTDGAPPWNAKAAKRPTKGMTIGIPKSFYVDDLETDIAKAFEDAIATFKKLGVRVVQVELPDQSLVSAAALVVIAVEAATTHAPWLRARPEDYGEQVRNRLANGLAYSGVQYLEALRW